MTINLLTGTMDINPSMGGWVITSTTAIVQGNVDLPLIKNDTIGVNGAVCRDGLYLGNVV